MMTEREEIQLRIGNLKYSIWLYASGKDFAGKLLTVEESVRKIREACDEIECLLKRRNALE